MKWITKSEIAQLYICGTSTAIVCVCLTSPKLVGLTPNWIVPKERDDTYRCCCRLDFFFFCFSSLLSVLTRKYVCVCERAKIRRKFKEKESRKKIYNSLSDGRIYVLECCVFCERIAYKRRSSQRRWEKITQTNFSILFRVIDQVGFLLNFFYRFFCFVRKFCPLNWRPKIALLILFGLWSWSSEIAKSSKYGNLIKHSSCDFFVDRRLTYELICARAHAVAHSNTLKANWMILQLCERCDIILCDAGFFVDHVIVDVI